MHKGILIGIIFIYLKIGLNDMAMKAIDQKARGRGGGGAEKKTKKNESGGDGGEEPDAKKKKIASDFSPPLHSILVTFIFFAPPPPPSPDFLAEIFFGAQGTTNRSRKINI